jgi:hypothetical protein
MSAMGGKRILALIFAYAASANCVSIRSFQTELSSNDFTGFTLRMRGSTN